MHKHLSCFLRNLLWQTRAAGSIAWYLCYVDEAVANTKIRKYVDHIYMTDSEKKVFSTSSLSTEFCLQIIAHTLPFYVC